jgi:hypothetical protein
MATRMSLMVGFKNPFKRTNEKGEKYTINTYYVFPKGQFGNTETAIEQLKADIKKAGYKVLTSPSGALVWTSTRSLIPEGCPIVRLDDGQWVADTTELDKIEQLSKRSTMLANRAMDKFMETADIVINAVEQLKREDAVADGVDVEADNGEDADPFK